MPQIVPVYLDLHGGLMGVGLDHLVMYPVREDGRALWLSARDAQGQVHGPAELAGRVDAHLRLLRARAWRLIVLLDVPAGAESGLAGCVAEQLYRLRLDFLRPLSDWMKELDAILVLALDTLERDRLAAGLPHDPPARLRAYLDAFGLVPKRAPDVVDVDERFRLAEEAVAEYLEGFAFLFTDDDVHAIAAAYKSPLLPDEVFRDEKVAKHLAAKDPIGQALQTARESLCQAVVVRVERKIERARTVPAAGPGGRYAEEALLRQVAEETRLDLAALDSRTLGDWLSLNPEALLQRVLRRVFGLAQQLSQGTPERWTLVRFGLTPVTGNLPRRHREMLELSYLLAALGQVSRDDLGHTGHPTYRAEVVLNDEAGGAMIGHYKARLAAAGRQVDERLQLVARRKVTKVDLPPFECRRGLDEAGFEATVDEIDRLGAVRRPMEPRWREWVADVNQGVDVLAEQGDAVFAACALDARQHFPAPREHEVSNIDVYAAECEAKLNRSRLRLLHYDAGAVTNTWTSDVEPVTEQILPLLAIRPSATGLARLALGVAGLLIVTQIVGPDSHATGWSAGAFSTWSLVAAVAALLSVGAAWWQLRVQIRRQITAARLRATALQRAVRDNLALRGRRLRDETALRAMQMNDHAARDAQRQAQHERLLLRHHDAALRAHQRRADEVAEIWGLVGPIPPAGEMDGRPISLAPDQAEYQAVNHVYAMTRLAHSVEIRVTLPEVFPRSVNASTLAGLSEIHIETDHTLVEPFWRPRSDRDG